jgi:cardiolipin synthase
LSSRDERRVDSPKDPEGSVATGGAGTAAAAAGTAAATAGTAAATAAADAATATPGPAAAGTAAAGAAAFPAAGTGTAPAAPGAGTTPAGAGTAAAPDAATAVPAGTAAATATATAATAAATAATAAATAATAATAAAAATAATAAAGTAQRRDRVVTLPNALSVLRLAAVPVFLWLLLGPRADLIALIVLMASGVSDWLDGKVARWLNQASRLGALLDPAADRLYIVATLVAFVLRGIVPWWLAVLLIGKDVVVGLCLPVLRRAGYTPPEVHYVGKAATFALLYAFPFLLLAQGGSTAAMVARPIGYAFTVWGTALYVWTGALYVAQVVIAVRRPEHGR